MAVQTQTLTQITMRIFHFIGAGDEKLTAAETAEGRRGNRGMMDVLI